MALALYLEADLAIFLSVHKRTWLVDHVVDPALALLYANAAPLSLRHQMRLGHQLGDLFGQHHVSAKEQSTGIHYNSRLAKMASFAAVFTAALTSLRSNDL